MRRDIFPFSTERELDPPRILNFLGVVLPWLSIWVWRRKVWPWGKNEFDALMSVLDKIMVKKGISETDGCSEDEGVVDTGVVNLTFFRFHAVPSGMSVPSRCRSVKMQVRQEVVASMSPQIMTRQRPMRGRYPRHIDPETRRPRLFPYEQLGPQTAKYRLHGPVRQHAPPVRRLLGIDPHKDLALGGGVEGVIILG